MQRCKVFFNHSLYESLTALYFTSNDHKKVYIQAMRLVFVLLEKLGETLFQVDVPALGENERLKKDRLNHKSQLQFNRKFMGELRN